MPSRDFPSASRASAVQASRSRAPLPEDQAFGFEAIADGGNRLLLRFARDPGLWELHARNAELSGDLVRAAESQAEGTFLRGRAFEALSQLEQVEKRSDLDYYQRARIQAQIARMAPLALAERERYPDGLPGG